MTLMPTTTPLRCVICAIILAVICIWLLHFLGERKQLQKYLPKSVVNFVTIGILIYTICIWIIGAMTTWIVTAHFAL